VANRPDLSEARMTGKIIRDKYAIEGIMGRGGMGVVFRARHVQLGSLVALKFMRPEVQEVPNAVERFLREARIAASLQSDHAVKIFDVDSDQDGTPYMAMEFLEGEELSKRLHRTGVIPAKEATGYALEMCAALSEAHAKNVVHRDLKPANMFLAKKWGGKEVLKLLDFGISKVQTEKAAELTGDGTSLGSPSYMAPEQMIASNAVDRRADIWSLGVCLYRFLSGKLPFDSESVWEVSLLVTTKEPVHLASLRADLPSALVAAVHKCLIKDPAKRFQSVEEVAEALSSVNWNEAALNPASERGIGIGVTQKKPQELSTGPRSVSLKLDPITQTAGEKASPSSSSSQRPSKVPNESQNWLPKIIAGAAIFTVLATVTIIVVVTRPEKFPETPVIATSATTPAEPSAGVIAVAAPIATSAQALPLELSDAGTKAQQTSAGASASATAAPTRKPIKTAGTATAKSNKIPDVR
jgi:eukaryotic-like serine/threonine-protein kinase